MTPQQRTILTHMRRAGHITNREAMIDHGIMALPKRITELEQMGYAIGREERKHPVTGQRYVRYWLKKGGAAVTANEADYSTDAYRSADGYRSIGF